MEEPRGLRNGGVLPAGTAQPAGTGQGWRRGHPACGGHGWGAPPAAGGCWQRPLPTPGVFGVLLPQLCTLPVFQRGCGDGTCPNSRDFNPSRGTPGLEKPSGAAAEPPRLGWSVGRALRVTPVRAGERWSDLESPQPIVGFTQIRRVFEVPRKPKFLAGDGVGLRGAAAQQQQRLWGWQGLMIPGMGLGLGLAEVFSCSNSPIPLPGRRSWWLLARGWLHVPVPGRFGKEGMGSEIPGIEP